MKRPAHSGRLKRSAQGFVLLLIVLSMLAIGAVVLLNGVATSTIANRQLQQVVAGSDALQAAKQALIGYAVNPPASMLNIRPGMLPVPDSLANGSYDGQADSRCLGNTVNGLPGVGSTSTIKRCLGKIPWKDLGLDIDFGQETHDPLGKVPWLAISANLASYDACLAVLNSDIANLSSPASASCSPGTWPYPQPTILPHPWLSVYDQNGSLLSDKVAVVLILPGPPLATETRNQSRTSASPGHPSDYLDSINLPLGCTSGCTTYDNAGLNNKFVMIPPGTRYPNNAANTALQNQLVPFNDTLVYITIDELMYYFERPVIGEMSKAMRSFKTNIVTGFTSYPWLQPISASFVDSASLYSQSNTTFGAFPFLMEYVAGSSNLPSYRTDFSWSVNSPTETTDIGGTVAACVQVKSVSGSLWMKNPLAGSLNGINAYSGAGPFSTGNAAVAKSTCKWLGGTKLACTYDIGTLPTKTMTLWTTQTRCDTNNSLTAGTLAVNLARTITFSSTLCGSPVTTYSNASGSTVHRWNFACSSVNGEAGIIVQDSISTAASGYNLLPKVVNVASNPSVPHSISVTAMRYAPIMPTWFYDNRWYLTAFAAIAPAAGVAPAAPSPNSCGTATSLTVGANSGVNAIVMLAGKTLGAVARPSSVITDYLESSNATGGSTCAFANAGLPVPSAFNDNLLVVSP